MDTLLGSSTSEVRLRRIRRRRRQKISYSSIDLSSLIKFHHFLSESVAFHSHERVSVPRPILTDLDDVFSKKHFRFTIPEIREISGLLGLSAFIDVPHTGMRLEGWRCLTVLLYKLSGTHSNNDVGLFFSYHPTTISKITRFVICKLIERWLPLLRWNNIARVRGERRRFSKAIHNAGGHLTNCIGFIDGTHREIARPVEHQQLFYSGHKHVHSLKFQAFTTPDGIIVSMFGPDVGSRHDMHLWIASDFESLLSAHFNHYVVYADQGYTSTLNGHIISPFAATYLTQQESDFNASMLLPRLSVEWGFMRITQLFPWFQRPTFLRGFSMLIAEHYLIATLLTNIRTCLDGHNIISSLFNCKPCSLREYLEVTL